MYMKGVIVTLSFLFVFSFASAQIEDGKFGLAKIQPQLDFTFCNTNEIDFLLGANAKNLYWGFGLYFTSIGVGKVASVGKSGVDFSSISNGVIMEENIFPE